MKLKYFSSASAEEKPCFDISEDLGGGNFGYIGEVFEEEKAELIVRAVNERRDLIEEIRSLHRLISFADYTQEIDEAVMKAVRTIKAAEQ